METTTMEKEQVERELSLLLETTLRLENELYNFVEYNN